MSEHLNLVVLAQVKTNIAHHIAENLSKKGCRHAVYFSQAFTSMDAIKIQFGDLVPKTESSEESQRMQQSAIDYIDGMIGVLREKVETGARFLRAEDAGSYKIAICGRMVGLAYFVYGVVTSSAYQPTELITLRPYSPDEDYYNLCANEPERAIEDDD
jgi:hypothetical protein